MWRSSENPNSEWRSPKEVRKGNADLPDLHAIHWLRSPVQLPKTHPPNGLTHHQKSHSQHLSFWFRISFGLHHSAFEILSDFVIRFSDFFYSFVIVSSRFKIVLLTIAQAATLCRFTSSGIALRSGTATLTASEEWFSK